MHIGESRQRIAFTVEDYFEPIELKNSPKYVKWIFRVLTKKGGVR